MGSTAMEIVYLQFASWLLFTVYLFGLPWWSRIVNDGAGAWRGTCWTPAEEIVCGDGANYTALAVELDRQRVVDGVAKYYGCGCGEAIFGDWPCMVMPLPVLAEGKTVDGFSVSYYIGTAPATGLTAAFSAFPILSMWYYGTGGVAEFQVINPQVRGVYKGSQAANLLWWSLGAFQLFYGLFLTFTFCYMPTIHLPMVILFLSSLAFHFALVAHLSGLSTPAGKVVTTLCGCGILAISVGMFFPTSPSLPGQYAFWLGECVGLSTGSLIAPLLNFFAAQQQYSQALTSEAAIGGPRWLLGSEQGTLNSGLLPSRGDYGLRWGEGAARCFSIESDFDEDESVRLMPIPECFICPMSQTPMEDPVMTVDGNVYERSYIEQWMRHRLQQKLRVTSPATNQELPSHRLVSLSALQKAIEAYLAHRPELRGSLHASRSFEEAAQLLQCDLLEKQAAHVSAEDELSLLRDSNEVLFGALGDAERTSASVRRELDQVKARATDAEAALEVKASELVALKEQCEELNAIVRTLEEQRAAPMQTAEAGSSPLQAQEPPPGRLVHPDSTASLSSSKRSSGRNPQRTPGKKGSATAAAVADVADAAPSRAGGGSLGQLPLGPGQKSGGSGRRSLCGLCLALGASLVAISLIATAVLPPESWLRSLAGLSIPGTFFASESWSVSNETLDWLSGQRDSYAQSASKGAKSRKEDKRQEERTREERRREE
ncbi:unnamed protein product, partial [Polarella glacialis]